MNVLVVEPGKTPYESDISPGLESLQKAVGGFIEAVYPYDDPVAIVCNEEGKLLGLPLNRALRDENGEVYDMTGIGCSKYSIICLKTDWTAFRRFQRITSKISETERFVIVETPESEDMFTLKSTAG